MSAGISLNQADDRENEKTSSDPAFFVLLGEDGCDAFQRPVDLVFGNDKGRCEPDDMFVCLFAEETVFTELLAEFSCAAGLPVKFNTDHKSPTAHFFDVRAFDLSQFVHEIGSEFRGVFYHSLFDENLERGTRHCSGKRVTAVGAAMVAGLEHSEHFFV